MSNHDVLRDPRHRRVMTPEKNPNSHDYGCECAECKRYYASVRDYEEALMNRINHKLASEVQS